MATQDQQTHAPNDLYDQAVLAAAPPGTTNHQGMMSVPAEHNGNLITRLFDAEARRHAEIERHEQNVIAEVIHANNLIGTAVADLVAVSLETEASYESTMEQYRDSRLAMATAPTYIQMARGIYTEGTGRVTRAGINSVAHKIEHR